jgi:DNA-binding response OmpR family regulator
MYKKNDVVLVSWPTQRELRHHCVNNRTPRILVLEANCEAPASEDILEDWVRAPISRRDLSARVEVLQRRYMGVCTPEIDECGELRYGVHSVNVSDTQAELARLLVCNFGEVVPREDLMEVLTRKSPGANRNALDLHIMRLRRRVSEADLGVTTVWGRGYRLGPSEERDDLMAGQWWQRPARRRTATQSGA